jgi:hypothetical protein
VQAILPEGPLRVNLGQSFEIVCNVRGSLSDLQAAIYKDQVSLNIL